MTTSKLQLVFLLVLGWFTVAFLAAQSPSAESTVDGVFAALFVSCVGAILGWVAWMLVQKYFSPLERYVLPIVGFSYFYGYLQTFFGEMLAYEFLPHRFLYSDKIFFPVFVFVIVTVTFLVRRWNLNALNILRYLIVVLAVMSVWNTGLWLVGQLENRVTDVNKQTELTSLQAPEKLFPIFWIVTDAYARSDILSEYYDYDNNEFITELNSRGFYTDSSAMTRFMYTGQVIPSTMEMVNLGELPVDSAKALMKSRSTSLWRFTDSQIASLLSGVGYEAVEHSSEYPTTVFNRAFPASYYESGLMRGLPSSLKLWIKRSGTGGVGLVQNLIQTAGNASSNNVLVFSYNLQPHPPYFFVESGPRSTPEFAQPTLDSRRALWHKKDEYISQLKYVNSQVLQTVDSILELSQVDPLIIIQSDHGPASNWQSGSLGGSMPSKDLFNEMFSVQNSILLPRTCDNDFLEFPTYSTDIFRFVLNSCFGSDLAMPNDEVYWGPVGKLWVYPEGVWIAQPEVR